MSVKPEWDTGDPIRKRGEEEEVRRGKKRNYRKCWKSVLALRELKI